MALTTKTKPQTTFDRLMKKPGQKELFDREYAEFLFSEFLLDEMKKKGMSVRKLSKETGISTSVIIGLRAQKKSTLTLKTMISLLSPFVYHLSIQKGNGQL